MATGALRVTLGGVGKSLRLGLGVVSVASTNSVASTPSSKGRGIRRGSVAIDIPSRLDDATSVPVSIRSLPNSAHSIL